MASSHIEIRGSDSRLASSVRAAVDRLRDVQEQFQAVTDIMGQVALGSDYAALATKLNVTAAEAEAVYALWGSANAEIRATFLAQLVARLG
jgi:hypothetical protein